MFGPTTRNRWGLARDVHLVAIEVNRGRGSVEGTMHFVGTDVRLLDGTSEYPFRPGEVLRSLRASYDAFVASSAVRIDAALARARVEPPADLGPWTSEVEAREIGVHITWNASTKRMTALFHTSRSLRGPLARAGFQAGPRVLAPRAVRIAVLRGDGAGERGRSRGAHDRRDRDGAGRIARVSSVLSVVPHQS